MYLYQCVASLTSIYITTQRQLEKKSYLKNTVLFCKMCKCMLPGASIFSCQASADHLPVRASAFLKWKFMKYVCAHIWWASQYNNKIPAVYLYLKPRFHIRDMRMRHCSSVCDIAVSMCFGHPLSPSDLFFLGSLPGHLNWMVESRSLRPGL